jgi:hypothetical protein
MRLSTPLTTNQWQRMRAGLVPSIDTLALVRGDQRKAPQSVGRHDLGCLAGYPIGAGRPKVFAGFAVPEGISLGSDSSAIEAGKWWTLRIQILPDGRCGVAVNNRVVWVSESTVPLDGPFWLRLGDESAGTLILHGALRVWIGVRTDVDW